MKFYTSVGKGSKLKVRKFWGLILTFLEVTGKKRVGGAFWPPPPSLIGLIGNIKEHEGKEYLMVEDYMLDKVLD